MTFPLMPMTIPNSRPGENWEDIGDVGYGDLRSVTSGVSGEFMAAADALSVLYSSDYGDTASIKNVTAGASSMFGIAYNAGLFVVANDAGDLVYSSVDAGDTWTLRQNLNTDNHNTNYNDGYFILGSGTSGGDGKIYFSTDGITWLVSPASVNNSMYCGIYVSSLNRTFAVGLGSQGRYRNNVPPYSSNGDTWTAATTGLTGVVYNVAWSTAGLVAVCVGTTGIFYSYDMIGWTKTLTATNIRGVAWCGEIFTAVGDDGQIYTSDDGISWTEQVSGTTEDLYGVTCTAGTIIATGNAGTVLRSS